MLFRSATVAATAIEQPMAALSDSSRSSGQTETSDDGKDRPQAVAHGQAVQAETRSFTAAVMTASLFEIQRDDTRISAPQIVRQIVESLEYTPAAGVHELVIRLKPDVFGELHIRLEMIDDAISARIITDSHPTRVMLTAHLSQLQDALQDKGLSVKDIQIEYATPNSGDSPSGHPEGDSGRRHSNYAIPTGRHPAEETSKPSAVAWRMERTVRSGGLDYLA